MSKRRIEIPRMAGQFARMRREELGLTKQELAKRSGVSEKTIYSFELGEKPNMHFAKLLAIYDALDLTLEVGEATPTTEVGPVPSSAEIVADFISRIRGDGNGQN